MAAIPTLQLNNGDSVPFVRSVFNAPNGIVIKTEKPDELKINDGFSVPIVIPDYNECAVPNGIVIKTEKPDKLQSYDGDSVNNVYHTTNGIVIKTENADELQSNNGYLVSVYNECNAPSRSVNSIEHDDTITPGVSTSSCQDCLVNKARVVTLSKNLTLCKEVIQIKDRKIVDLKKQNECLKEKIDELKKMIKLLKQNESDRYLYKKLSDRVEVKEILNAIYLKNVKNKKRCFSREAKVFAVTLYSYSPAAYNYFRKTFHYCLPYTSTVQQWCKNLGVKIKSGT